MKQARQTVMEMITGLGIWSVTVLLVLVIVADRKLAVAAGVLVGALTAAGLIWHMYRHIDMALDMESGQAQKHTQFAAMQRLGIMAVVLAVSMAGYRYIHPIGVALGIFGMKISAFMQPMVHNLWKKRKLK